MELHSSFDQDGMTDFNEEVDYVCTNGRKFHDDIFKHNETMNCTEGNIWINEFGACNESECGIKWSRFTQPFLICSISDRSVHLHYDAPSRPLRVRPGERSDRGGDGHHHAPGLIPRAGLFGIAGGESSRL